MISIQQSAKLAAEAEYTYTRLSPQERERLAKAALLVGEVRSLTLDRAYWARTMQILGDLAPTLADQLNRLIAMVEQIHQRIPMPDRRFKIGPE